MPLDKLPTMAELGELIGRLNHKSVLQERTQALGFPVPRYTTVETSGPEHAKVFTVEARIGNELMSRATGTSKKAASQQAAQLLLEKLDFLAERDTRNGAAKEPPHATR